MSCEASEAVGGVAQGFGLEDGVGLGGGVGEVLEGLGEEVVLAVGADEGWFAAGDPGAGPLGEVGFEFCEAGAGGGGDVEVVSVLAWGQVQLVDLVADVSVPLEAVRKPRYLRSA